MCGIAGILQRDGNRPVRLQTMRRMLGALRHRGPDQFGLYAFQDERSAVSLGSARLSIIDIAGGQQPIGNEDGTVWIVFNGEIFNYVELRATLLRLGHRLQSSSDTEVIVHLYEEYGPGCVEYLNGQFAFAIWDERESILFLARDRTGIHPLYYWSENNTLIFGSEIKAVLSDERVTAVLDPIALDQIFTCWSPLGSRTCFQGIQSLPPGHWLLAQGEQIAIEPYWSLSFPDAGELLSSPSTIDAAAAQLRELLSDAVRLRLRADVPVGAYLSGGLDSSAITALIRHLGQNRLETFSIAFSDAAYDERRFQQQMAQHLGTRHHCVTVDHRQIGELFPRVIWHTETPIMRTSPVPLFMLSQLVRQHDFKVVLTGEGADEVFAGYNLFKEDKIRRFWARQPASAIRPLLLTRLYEYVGDLNRINAAYLTRFFGQGLSAIAAPEYSHAILWHSNSRSRRILAPHVLEQIARAGLAPVEAVGLPPRFASWQPLAQAQYLQFATFLSGYLLSSQGDRMTMAHSVEGRLPFLDHRIIEFANTLPAHFKLRGLNEKYLLKRAMRDLLPESILERPKRPYRAPIHRSFFPDGKPLEWVGELLSAAQIDAAGIFNPQAVSRLQARLARQGTLGETDDMALAGLLSTQLLHQQFIAGFQPPPPINDADDIKTVAHLHHSETAH